MMSGVLLEVGSAIKTHWNNKFFFNQKTFVKPEAAITVFELLMMSGVSPETC
jgi:hypothetical protein